MTSTSTTTASTDLNVTDFRQWETIHGGVGFAGILRRGDQEIATFQQNGNGGCVCWMHLAGWDALRAAQDELGKLPETVALLEALGFDPATTPEIADWGLEALLPE
jgi:hypothetical protein